MDFILSPLPPKADLETPTILKQLAKSHRYLAELKGTSGTIPNENILIDTLTLQEAKDSSEIENIVTTHDDLYKENILIESKSLAAKEVYNYARGLKLGFQTVRKEKMLLNKHILRIHKELLGNEAGFKTGGHKSKRTRMHGLHPASRSQSRFGFDGDLKKFINWLIRGWGLETDLA